MEYTIEHPPEEIDRMLKARGSGPLPVSQNLGIQIKSLELNFQTSVDTVLGSARFRRCAPPLGQATFHPQRVGMLPPRGAFADRHRHSRSQSAQYARWPAKG